MPDRRLLKTDMPDLRLTCPIGERHLNRRPIGEPHASSETKMRAESKRNFNTFKYSFIFTFCFQYYLPFTFSSVFCKRLIISRSWLVQNPFLTEINDTIKCEDDISLSYQSPDSSQSKAVPHPPAGGGLS